MSGGCPPGSFVLQPADGRDTVRGRDREPEVGERDMAGEIAAKEPKGVTLEAGKSYAWCACGLSKNQPFCDGTHNGL